MSVLKEEKEDPDAPCHIRAWNYLLLQTPVPDKFYDTRTLEPMRPVWVLSRASLLIYALCATVFALAVVYYSQYVTRATDVFTSPVKIEGFTCIALQKASVSFSFARLPFYSECIYDGREYTSCLSATNQSRLDSDSIYFRDYDSCTLKDPTLWSIKKLSTSNLNFEQFQAYRAPPRIFSSPRASIIGQKSVVGNGFDYGSCAGFGVEPECPKQTFEISFNGSSAKSVFAVSSSLYHKITASPTPSGTSAPWCQCDGLNLVSDAAVYEKSNEMLYIWQQGPVVIKPHSSRPFPQSEAHNDGVRLSSQKRSLYEKLAHVPINRSVAVQQFPNPVVMHQFLKPKLQSVTTICGTRGDLLSGFSTGGSVHLLQCQPGCSAGNVWGCPSGGALLTADSSVCRVAGMLSIPPYTTFKLTGAGGTSYYGSCTLNGISSSSYSSWPSSYFISTDIAPTPQPSPHVSTLSPTPGHGGLILGDGTYVDSSGELQNVLTAMDSSIIRHVVSLSTLLASMPSRPFIIIPELEVGNIILSAAQMTSLKNYVLNGGLLVLMGDNYGHSVSLANRVFGFSLASTWESRETINYATISYAANLYSSYSSVVGSTLPNQNAVYPVSLSSIPSHALNVYSTSNGNSWVWEAVEGSGKVVYFGFDWFEVGTTQWNNLLNHVIDSALSTVAPTKSPSFGTTSPVVASTQIPTSTPTSIPTITPIVSPGTTSPAVTPSTTSPIITATPTSSPATSSPATSAPTASPGTASPVGVFTPTPTSTAWIANVSVRLGYFCSPISDTAAAVAGFQYVSGSSPKVYRATSEAVWQNAGNGTSPCNFECVCLPGTEDAIERLKIKALEEMMVSWNGKISKDVCEPWKDIPPYTCSKENENRVNSIFASLSLALGSLTMFYYFAIGSVILFWWLFPSCCSSRLIDRSKDSDDHHKSGKGIQGGSTRHRRSNSRRDSAIEMRWIRHTRDRKCSGAAMFSSENEYGDSVAA